MRAAQTAKMIENQCISNMVPSVIPINPPGNPLPRPAGPSILSNLTHPAMHETKNSELGMGNPSKYCDFPVESLGINATVALKRARRAMPQQIKVLSAKMSSVERQPMVNARKAGATPKETCSATEKGNKVCW